MKKLTLYIFLLVLSGVVLGQSNPNYHTRQLIADRDSIQLDSLLILPSTVQVWSNNTLVPQSDYRINVHDSYFIPSEGLKKKKASLRIQYRVFPYPIHKSYFKRELSQVNSSIPREISFNNSPSSRNGQLFGGSLLNKSGSLSRGISFGNNQDVVVDSKLNLQLSGRLNNKVHILAALSDNNIPLQPDGNTQQIQDFDRIFIKLFDEEKELILGDYELESPKGTFMQFYRKVQGGKFSGTLHQNKTKERQWKTTLSGSISKGKYNRMKIQGAEGNQGPYRLRGKNNEAYIIVLAGSEKIYLNGELLTRGEKNDYTINYNTAELSFTPQRPINSTSRIVAEFEYSQENYARYLLFNSHELQLKNARFHIDFYSEQDSRNQPLDQNLSNQQKELLSQVGDQLELARVPRIDTVEYSNDRVLYKAVNKIIEGETKQVYQHSTHPDSARLQVSFSFVGENKGNYVPVKSSANGRVYEWVAPQNGVPSGSYDPIAQLSSPEKHQMLSLGGAVELDEYTSTHFELALSNRDQNTFSRLNDQDNKGYAMDFQMEKLLPLKDTIITATTKASYRFVHENFSEIEPFEEVEYQRDWNLEAQEADGSEHFVKASTTLQHQTWGQLGYELAYRKRSTGYKGLRHSSQLQLDRSGFHLNFSGQLLQTDQDLLETNFLRHKLGLAKDLSFLTLGFESESERNEWTSHETKSILSNSFAFESMQFYVASPEKNVNQLKVHYTIRTDRLPQEDQLRTFTKAEDFGLSYELLKNPNNQLKTKASYRQLKILNEEISNQQAENTLLGQLEHFFRARKGLLQSNTFYQIGSGLEAEKEFSYIEVAPGQGVYRWQDYNENQVKELDEFEVANFQDEANYIRIFTPSDKYQRVYTNEFRQTLHLRFQKLKNNKGLLKLLSRFQNRLAYRVSQKSSNHKFTNYANPFQNNTNSKDFVSLNSGFQNTLSYKRKAAKTSWDYITLKNNNKLLLANGFEQHRLQQDGLRFRWKFAAPYQLKNRLDKGIKSYNNEFFPNKNYKIDFVKNHLSLSFQPSLMWQFGFDYQYDNKKNQPGQEKAEIHRVGNEIQFALRKNGKLSINSSYLNVSYTAASNTSLAYEMMEGFLPGNNATWQFAFNKKISKTFQLRIAYNGRYSEGGDVIHTGNMELRAHF